MDKTQVEAAFSISSNLPLDSLVSSLMGEKSAKQGDIEAISRFFAMYSELGKSYVLAAREAIRQAASELREDRAKKAVEELSGIFGDIDGLMKSTDIGDNIRGLNGVMQAYERMKQMPSDSAFAGLQGTLVDALKHNLGHVERIFGPVIDGLGAAGGKNGGDGYWLSLSEAVAAVDRDLSGTGTAIQGMMSAVSYLGKVPKDLEGIGRWEDAAYGRIEEGKTPWAGKRFWKGMQAVDMVTKDWQKARIRLQDEYATKLKRSISEMQGLLPAEQKISGYGARLTRARKMYNALEPDQREGLWEPVSLKDYVRNGLKAGLEAPPLKIGIYWGHQCAVALNISQNPDDLCVNVYFASSPVKF